MTTSIQRSQPSSCGGAELLEVFTDCIRYTEGLLYEWGLTDWSIKFDRALARAGLCNSGTKTIHMSRHFVARSSKDQIENVIKHEVAHAIVGAHHGHDHVWKDMAIKLGCDGHRCVQAFVPYRYHIKCSCGKISFGRHRLHKSCMDKVCKACNNKVVVTLNM